MDFFPPDQPEQLKPLLFERALRAAGLPHSDASQLEQLPHRHQPKPRRNPCVFISLKVFQRGGEKAAALPYFVLYFRKFKRSNILFLLNVPQSAKWSESHYCRCSDPG